MPRLLGRKFVVLVASTDISTHDNLDSIKRRVEGPDTYYDRITWRSCI